MYKHVAVMQQEAIGAPFALRIDVNSAFILNPGISQGQPHAVDLEDEVLCEIWAINKNPRSGEGRPIESGYVSGGASAASTPPTPLPLELTHFYNETEVSPSKTRVSLENLRRLPKHLTLGNIISNGNSATVYRLKERAQEKNEAMRVVSKTTSDTKKEMTNIEVLRRLDHPNIIRIEAYEDDENIYTVMPLMRGNLRELMPELKQAENKDDLIKTIILQLLAALNYCHENNISHNDIKPENICIDEYGNAVLIDFELAGPYNPEHETPFAGTTLYMPPEAHNGTRQAYNKQDIWALGVTLMHLTDESLYVDEKTLESKSIMEEISLGIDIGITTKNSQYTDPTENSLNGFIAACTIIYSRERWTVKQLLEHPFLARFDTSPEFLEQLTELPTTPPE